MHYCAAGYYYAVKCKTWSHKSAREPMNAYTLEDVVTGSQVKFSVKQRLADRRRSANWVAGFPRSRIEVEAGKKRF